MLPIRVIVRTDTDWAGMTWDRFYNQRAQYQPQAAILEAKTPLLQDETTPGQRANLINLWEEATGREYFQYRGEVKALCTAELRKLPTRLTVGLWREAEWQNPEEEILIPLDDDDVIFSSVTEVAQHFEDPSVNVVLWDRHTDHLGEETIYLPRAYFDTCNYAVRKSWLLEWPSHIAGHFLNNHQFANAIVKKRLGMVKEPLFRQLIKGNSQLKVRTGVMPIIHPTVKCVPGRFSCYYLHSASISFLLRKMRRDVNPVELIRTLSLHPLIERSRYV